MNITYLFYGTWEDPLFKGKDIGELLKIILMKMKR